MGSDTQDPFATTAPVDDPFAATTTAPASAIGDAPEDDAPAAAPPVVDREGREVNTTTGEITEAATEAAPANAETPVEPQAEEARAATPEEAAATPEAVAAPAPEAEVATDAPDAPQEAASAAVEAPAQPEVATQADGGDQPPAQPAATAAAADGDEGGVEETAAEGKSPWRHYALLYQTADKQWTEYDLSSLPDDLKQYAESKPLNDKKPEEGSFLFLKARNADHARRIAWVIFGRPEAGVTVNPVARSSWKPKRLSKAPPQPERERLVIS